MVIIFSIIVSLLFFIIIGYDILLNFLDSSKLDRVKKIPSISVIVPTFNEETNIEKKLTNLLECDYPWDKMDIYVVDSSTDKTKEIAEQFPVHILECNKKGKIYAINKAINHCDTDIIILTDADTTLEKNSLKKIVSCFSDNFGAVSGFVKEKRNDGIYIDSKVFYHKRDWDIRYKEGLIDSTCSLDGKFLAFKKSLIKKIPKSAFTDDFEITLLLRKKGYRCVIDKESIVYETPPQDIFSDINRMRRIMKLTILTSFRHLNVLFNPKYGFFGLFTFPFRRFLNMFTPFMAFYIFIYLLMEFPLLLIYLIILTSFLTLITFKKTLYYLVLFIALSLSWLDILLGKFERGAIWKKNN